MTCLVTLPNCRHNIVVITLSLEPEECLALKAYGCFQLFILWVEIGLIGIGGDGMGQNKRGRKLRQELAARND